MTLTDCIITERPRVAHSGLIPAIIAISGKQYAGKDTLCQLLLRQLPAYQRIGLADALKDEYGLTHCLTRSDIELLKTQDPSVRLGLIELGQFRRQENPHYWLERVMTHEGPKIITDMRYLNELEFFKAQGAWLFRVEAPAHIRAERGILGHENNISETQLDHYTGWTHVFENNGDVCQLADQLQQFLRSII
jgi:Phosphomevalonate kinase